MDNTGLVRRRYDRVAPIYDAVESLMELHSARWRRQLWAAVGPGEVLEIGVGTGKNLRYYPAGAEVTAIDISPRMLARAQRRAHKLGSAVHLMVADAQVLPFADASFDTVVSTYVFCSVPDPLLGLREARRVLRPGGRLLMIEHVASRRRILGWILRRLDPLVTRLWGAHLDRDTVANVAAAGFAAVAARNLMFDFVKRIDARCPG